MDKYQDIHLRPSVEFEETLLLNIIFQRVHQALAHQGHGRTAVSFPGYKLGTEKNPSSLGTIIRLHGTAEDLDRVSSYPRLQSFVDYAQINPAQPARANAKHRVLRRVQAKSSTVRLFRRSVRKGWITEEQALQRLKQTSNEKLHLPYLQLSSHSTGQKFRLYLELGPETDHPVPGQFSTYGLSTGATVPWSQS